MALRIGSVCSRDPLKHARLLPRWHAIIELRAHGQSLGVVARVLEVSVGSVVLDEVEELVGLGKG